MKDAALGLPQALHAALMPDYNRKAAAYWWTMLSLGAAAFAEAARTIALQPSSVQLQVLAGCVASMAAGAFPVRIPGTKSSFAVAEIFIFLLMLRVGPEAACIAAAGEAFVASMLTSKRWTSRLISPAIAAIAITLAGACFVAVTRGLQSRQLYDESMLLVLVTALAAAHFMLSSSLIQLVLRFKQNEPLRLGPMLRSFGWVGTTYCANAFVAVLLYLASRQAGPVVLLSAAPVIALMLSTLHFHFRQREAEAAQARARLHAAERENALAARHNLELRRIADHDGLTSLANRRRFLELLAQAIEQATGGRGREFAVMYLDFDRFKLINDQLGHAAGDEFLVHVAGRLEHQVRHGDLVGRLGGDEFGVLVCDLGSKQQAIELAERLLEELRKPYSVAGTEVVSSASIGITFSRYGYLTPDQMLRDADAAMYGAKSLGRARYVVCPPPDGTRVQGDVARGCMNH